MKKKKVKWKNKLKKKTNNIKNISIYSNIDDLLDYINEGENV